jgi:FkbM family methyltransferase
VLHVRDDEQLLPGRLAAIQPFVDEIVVVNCGCSDRSLDIAKEYGARIVERTPNPTDTSVSSKWVLQIGVDEIITEREALKLSPLIASVPNGVVGIVVKLCPIGGNGADDLPVRDVRLFASSIGRPLQEPGTSELLAYVRQGGGALAEADFTIHVPPERLRSDSTALVHRQIQEPWLIPWVPKRGRVFIDIGANVGTWTKWLAPSFEVVHAVEPNPAAWSGLAANLPSNVVIHQIGAWTDDTTINFTQFCESVHLSAYFKEEGINTGPKRGDVILPCKRIDSLPIEGYVDFIKCDTEGAEVECITGCENLIVRDKPWLLIEVHSSEKFSQLVPMLIKWRYLFSIIRDPNYEPFSRLWYEHFWLSCQAQR